jgi:protein arginine N-methyltransferase 1
VSAQVRGSPGAAQRLTAVLPGHDAAQASYAETLVRSHGLEGVVSVVRGRVEEIELPEKVDVLVSEWMGYFLLRESMVQSVLVARDRWLRPGGAMYPSEARLLLAEMTEPGFVEARDADVADAMSGWDALGDTLADRYGLDMSALREAYSVEQVRRPVSTRQPSHVSTRRPH